MVEILGFRALRYAPAVVGAWAGVVAPPYDVIGPAELKRLWHRSPYNVVHLDLPAGDLAPAQKGEGYRLAAERLRTWKEVGALTADREPALYLYRQRFQVPGQGERTRRGFFALLRLTEWGAGVFPHERTLPGPVADRIRLLDACRGNLSSIFGLYSDPRQEVMAALETPLDGQPALAEALDERGVWHGLWAIRAPAVLARVAGLLRERPVIVADGHHRYTAALQYRAQQRAANGRDGHTAPWEYVLMYLGALEDPGLLILPTHQVVHGLEGFTAEGFMALARRSGAVRELPTLAALNEALTAPAAVALGAVLPGGRYYLLETQPAAQAEAPEEGLDVHVLRRQLVEPLLAQHGAAEDLEGHMRYTHEATEADAWVQAGEADVAFIVRPTRLEQVREVALAHRVMPQKSTYFYPKLLSGLLFYDYGTDGTGVLSI